MKNQTLIDDDLSPDEAAVRGEPGDLVDETRVPPRSGPQSAMFSLRIDRQTFEALSDLAEAQGRRFSDVARAALRAYVRPDPDHASRVLLEAIAAKLGVEPQLIELSSDSQPALGPAGTERQVVPDRHGGWVVVDPLDAGATEHFETQAAAIKRAREQLTQTGGGELRVHGRDGRLRDTGRISPGAATRLS